jgi:hypothetical protein
MRFAAQALQGLKGLAGSRVGKAVLPQSGAEWMMSVVPNVAFAGMTAMNQPEGTDGLTRFGAGAEDLGLSLMLQTLGRGGGHALVGGARHGGIDLSPDMAMTLKGASEVGTEALGFMALPEWTRPFAKKAYDDYGQRMSEQQRDELAARDEEIRREALVAAGIRGYMFPPGMQLPLLGSAEGGMV